MSNPTAAHSAKFPPIGIDLGTTMSAAAIALPGRGIQTIRDSAGRHLTPSVVHLGREVTVGDDALALESAGDGETADAFKRDMGKAHYERKLRDHYWTPPEVLSAFVLKKLRDDARHEYGDVPAATIAVPAYFDEPRRQATLSAGRLAGFEQVQLINEPTAAALAHFYMQGKRDDDGNFRFPDSRLLVFDLGGGTLDVSILEASGNTFRTLATDGAVKLGGLDFDKCIVDYVANQFCDQHQVDPRTDQVVMRRLWRDAQEAKHQLSQRQRTTLTCKFSDLRLGVDLSRETFERLIERYMVLAMIPCSEALRHAGLAWGDLDDVLLVGGSSRVPLVARRMEEASGRKPRMVASPDEAIAQGAAIFAATQAQGFLPRMEVINVNAHSLGIAGTDVRTNLPINKILIPRNTPLPATGHYKFVTKEANQERAAVRLLEGESENPRNCLTVAKCVIELAPGIPAHTEVVVTCCYGADGVISTSAKVPRTQQTAHVEISREGPKTLETLEAWRTRLTTGAEPEAHEDADAEAPPAYDAASSTIAEGVARLDFLAMRVGQIMASRTPPVQALPIHRALMTARQELEAIRRTARLVSDKLDKATGQRDRMALDSDAAVLRIYQQQTARFVDQVTSSLGRECIAADYLVDECNAYAIEHRKLSSQLQQALAAR